MKKQEPKSIPSALSIFQEAHWMSWIGMVAMTVGLASCGEESTLAANGVAPSDVEVQSNDLKLYSSSLPVPGPNGSTIIVSTELDAFQDIGRVSCLPGRTSFPIVVQITEDQKNNVIMAGKKVLVTTRLGKSSYAVYRSGLQICGLVTSSTPGTSICYTSCSISPTARQWMAGQLALGAGLAAAAVGTALQQVEGFLVPIMQLAESVP